MSVLEKEVFTLAVVPLLVRGWAPLRWSREPWKGDSPWSLAGDVYSFVDVLDDSF